MKKNFQYSHVNAKCNQPGGKTVIIVLLFLCFFALFYIAVSDYCYTSEQFESYSPAGSYVGTHLANSWQSMSIDNNQSNNEEKWCLTLVNRWKPLKQPVVLQLVTLENGKQVDEKIYPYLQKMFNDMQSVGIYPTVASGYRTWEDQQRIYNEKYREYKAQGFTDEQAKKETENWVAVPGTSEHQLGLAIDINADGIHSTGNEVYAWLKEHAHQYGFINRYPTDKTAITGVANEPWHYRYVGIKAAKEIYESGVCLEEYLNQAK